MKWGALLVCALFAFTAHTAFAAQGMSAAGYEKTYGINIPFTPSQRTSRYTFAVYEGETAGGTALVQKELTITEAQTLFLALPYDYAAPETYTLAVTAHPMPGREGMDKAATKTSAFTTAPTCGHTADAGGYLAGDGSEQSPYVVSTQAQLSHLRQHSAACFWQSQDITLSGTWTSIPTFSGSYDGGGHIIYDLQVASSAEGALFQDVTGASFSRLGFVSRGADVGAVYTSGTLGRNLNQCTIDQCFVDVNINGVPNRGSDVGGFAKALYDTTITNSYSASTLSGNALCAGMSCYLQNGTMNNCYSVSSISGGSAGVGGLITTYNPVNPKVTNSYWLLGPASSPGGGVRITDKALFGQEATFAGWDFENIWTMGTVYADVIGEEITAPVLRAFQQTGARDYSLPQGAEDETAGLGFSE